MTLNGWLQRLPGLQVLREYQLAWLRNDIVAGIVLSTMLVPVGIAYAVASGVPGDQRPVRDDRPAARLCAVRAEPDPRARAGFVACRRSSSAWSFHCPAATPTAAVAIAAAMAVVSGASASWPASSRLGFVTELLSKPIRYGYMNGIALAVMISQLPKLLGFKIDSDWAAARPLGDRQGVAEGKANWTALSLGVATLAVILVLKAHKRMPAILFAVLVATVVVGLVRPAAAPA